MKENQRESKRMKGQILAISDYLRLQASKSLPCVDQNCRGAWCWQVLVGTAYGFAGSLWDSSQVLSTFSKRISILGTGYAEHIGLELVWNWFGLNIATSSIVLGFVVKPGSSRAYDLPTWCCQRALQPLYSKLQEGCLAAHFDSRADWEGNLLGNKNTSK